MIWPTFIHKAIIQLDTHFFISEMELRAGIICLVRDETSAVVTQDPTI